MRDWVAPADIVASALQRLRPVLSTLQLELQVPPQLPLLYVHAALIEQALVNVLENAARFSPLLPAALPLCAKAETMWRR